MVGLQGIWRPQKIANPAYYKDDTPLANIGKIDAAAIEIWTMDNNYYFNDIVVANDPAVAEEFRLKTWTAKHEAEVTRPCLFPDDLCHIVLSCTQERTAPKSATSASTYCLTCAPRRPARPCVHGTLAHCTKLSQAGADICCAAFFIQEAEAKKKEAEEEAKRKSEETKESSADALSEKLNGWFYTLVDKVCSRSSEELSACLQSAVLL